MKLMRPLLLVLFLFQAPGFALGQFVLPGGQPLPAFSIAGQSVKQLVAGPAATRLVGNSDLIIRRADGSIRWWRGSIAAPGPRAGLSKTAYADVVKSALESVSDEMRLASPSEELRLIRTETDSNGNMHLRMQQIHEGIPIWKSVLVTHISSSGELYAINGDYFPALRLLDNGTATLRPAEVLALIPAEYHIPFLREEVVEPALNYVDGGDGKIVLAYVVRRTTSLAESWEFVVDANTGELLFQMPLHASHSESQGSYETSSSLDLHGQVRQIRTYRETDGTQAMIWDLPNIDPSFSLVDGPSFGGLLTSQMLGANIDVAQPTNGVWDPRAVSVHLNAAISYNYFSQLFGRKAIDNEDGTIYTLVGADMDNATWNGYGMSFGNGSSANLPWSGALDIVAHEMTHGVVQHTAGLEYVSQSGALNESFADVFGVLIEGDDYLIGEDITITYPATRDLSNPSRSDIALPQPSHMNEYVVLPETEAGDNGGVHVNSGIPNYAAFLIIEAIGATDAAHICYRALTDYLTQRSQFVDARFALESAAIDLFGDESAQLNAVRNAYDAVGITYDLAGIDYTSNDVEIADGASSIAMIDAANRLLLLDMATETVFEYPDAPLVGNSSQLSVPRGSQVASYVDENGVLTQLNLISGEFTQSPGAFASTPGDMRNAAVAPDASVFAFSSSDLSDGSLYFTDLQSAALRLPLLTQTTQQGIFDESIVYPDVISWSPNMESPLVAFDALRSVDIGPNRLSFWSTYVIDFTAGRISNLIPSQAQSVDVANFTYSATDPDLVAFNLFDRLGTTYLLVCDFSRTDSCVEVGQAFGFSDAERPSFSPDNSTIAFSSAAQSQLVVAASDASTAIAYSFNQPVRNPFWFALADGTSTEISGVPELPAAIEAINVYPNPAGSQFSTHLRLAASQNLTLSVHDLLGRRVFQSTSEFYPAGEQDITIDSSSWANGLYFISINVDGDKVSAPLLVRH